LTIADEGGRVRELGPGSEREAEEERQGFHGRLIGVEPDWFYPDR
jgi:hypothetical protein